MPELCSSRLGWAGAIPPLQVVPEDLLQAVDLGAREVMELATLLCALAVVDELLAIAVSCRCLLARLRSRPLRAARRA